MSININQIKSLCSQLKPLNEGQSQLSLAQESSALDPLQQLDPHNQQILQQIANFFHAQTSLLMLPENIISKQENYEEEKKNTNNLNSSTNIKSQQPKQQQNSPQPQINQNQQQQQLGPFIILQERVDQLLQSVIIMILQQKAFPSNQQKLLLSYFQTIINNSNSSPFFLLKSIVYQVMASILELVSGHYHKNTPIQNSDIHLEINKQLAALASFTQLEKIISAFVEDSLKVTAIIQFWQKTLVEEAQIFAFNLIHQAPVLIVEFFCSKTFVNELEDIDAINEYLDINQFVPKMLKLFREQKLQQFSKNFDFYFDALKPKFRQFFANCNEIIGNYFEAGKQYILDELQNFKKQTETLTFGNRYIIIGLLKELANKCQKQLKNNFSKHSFFEKLESELIENFAHFILERHEFFFFICKDIAYSNNKLMQQQLNHLIVRDVEYYNQLINDKNQFDQTTSNTKQQLIEQENQNKIQIRPKSKSHEWQEEINKEKQTEKKVMEEQKQPILQKKRSYSQNIVIDLEQILNQKKSLVKGKLQKSSSSPYKFFSYICLSYQKPLNPDQQTQSSAQKQPQIDNKDNDIKTKKNVLSPIEDFAIQQDQKRKQSENLSSKKSTTTAQSPTKTQFSSFSSNSSGIVPASSSPPPIETLQFQVVEKLKLITHQVESLVMKKIVRQDGHPGILVESRNGIKYIIHENEVESRIVIVNTQFVSSKWLQQKENAFFKSEKLDQLIKDQQFANYFNENDKGCTPAPILQQSPIMITTTMTNIGASLGYCLANINNYQSTTDFLKDFSYIAAINGTITYVVQRVPLFGTLIIIGGLGYKTLSIVNNKVDNFSSKVGKFGKLMLEGGTTVGGSISGAILGQALIPVPILGALVGGVIGGFIVGSSSSWIINKLNKSKYKEMIDNLKLQMKPQGFWPCSDMIFDIYGIKKTFFEESIPSNLKKRYNEKNRGTYWMTTITYCLLTIHQAQKDEQDKQMFKEKNKKYRQQQHIVAKNKQEEKEFDEKDDSDFYSQKWPVFIELPQIWLISEGVCILEYMQDVEKILKLILQQ